MARFEDAIETVLRHEGGFVDDPADAGGETKYGISSRAYPGVDIAGLTKEQACEIYKRDYWQYDGIENQEVATKVFDLAVNMGQKQATKLLQRAANVCGAVLRDDGLLGPATVLAVNGSKPDCLLTELRAQAAMFYCELALKNPSQGRFLRGWLRRAVS